MGMTVKTARGARSERTSGSMSSSIRRRTGDAEARPFRDPTRIRM